MFSGQGPCIVRVVHHRQSCVGKTFQRGRRVTFWWSAVRRGITGVDIGRELSSLLLAAVGEQGLPESPPRLQLRELQSLAKHIVIIVCSLRWQICASLYW